ncbi:MAG: hypothetical protein AAF663_05915 [Planctomycetota bacterium]
MSELDERIEEYREQLKEMAEQTPFNMMDDLEAAQARIADLEAEKAELQKQLDDEKAEVERLRGDIKWCLDVAYDDEEGLFVQDVVDRMRRSLSAESAARGKGVG